MNTDRTTVRERILTQAMVALAVLALFAGASVGASLEEFAAPTYAEDNAYSGAVDDSTDDSDWKAMDSHKGMKNGAKSLIGSFMSKGMDDRMDNREAHLEERIAIGQESVIAYQYCIDSAECDVESTELQDMIDNINSRHAEMQEKLNSDDKELSEESKGEIDNNDWGEWNIDQKRVFSDDRAMMLEAGRVAISFCINSEDCTANHEVLAEVLEHISVRHANHQDCSEEERCERGDDDRRGLMERLQDAMRRGPRGGADHQKSHMDIGPDVCKERGGEWNLRAYPAEATDRGEGVYYCNFWFDGDREIDDREMTQEDCGARGGTWTQDDTGDSYCDFGQEDDRENSEESEDNREEETTD